MPIKLRARDVARPRGPESLNAEEKSVEVVASTEKPIRLYDWYSDEEYDEVVLMSGANIPKNGQVPLCDSHDRESVNSVLGSFRDIRAEGDELVGKVYFSNTPEGASAFQKLSEGHLTDFSIGFQVKNRIKIHEGGEKEVAGKKYKGPASIIDKWELFELSICPVGADPFAKARNSEGASDMNILERIRSLLLGAGVKPDEEALKNLVGGIDERERAEGGSGKDEKAPVKDAKGKDKADDPEDEEKADVPEDDAEEDVKKPEKGKKARGLDAVAAERERVRAITLAGRQMGVPTEQVDKWIGDGTSEVAAKARMLDMLGEERGRTQVPYGRVQVGRDEGERFRARVSSAIALRAGLKEEKPEPGADELQWTPLAEIARMCLAQKGERASGPTHRYVERALSTTDLPNLLIATTERILVDSYSAASENWQQWTGSGEVPDFKALSLISTDFDGSLKIIYEGGEYELAKAKESTDSVKIDTYGRMFALTRRSIVNDDLNGIVSRAQELGQGVSRLIGNLVYGTLTANPLMSDGKVLFSPDHNNTVVAADAGNGPNVENLTAAINKMAAHQNMAKDYLQIAPEFFLTPVALQAKAQQFFVSQMIGTAALPTTQNIYHGYFAGKTFASMRLDGASPSTWYLVGPRERGIVVYYLSGQRAPYFASQEGFKTDGIEYKVRFDVAVKAIDWRNFVRVSAE
jgi:hypothetical protein